MDGSFSTSSMARSQKCLLEQANDDEDDDFEPGSFSATAHKKIRPKPLQRRYKATNDDEDDEGDEDDEPGSFSATAHKTSRNKKPFDDPRYATDHYGRGFWNYVMKNLLCQTKAI
ncbi:uncharacterized protein LOC142230765 [Haematobia irritans]|uniref:uncharacterized protein LOC142230765 n=1 Tax=Haematobia irritans TaxID=7368 RepID=UPI003F50AED6